MRALWTPLYMAPEMAPVLGRREVLQPAVPPFARHGTPYRA